MTRPLAVYTDTVDTDPRPGIELLENAGFDVRVAGSADPAVIAHLAADADALLIGYSKVDRELFESLGNLKIVATQSVGVDMVDTAVAAERGIWVTNVPAAATEEVASHAFAMTLALLRGLPFLDRDVRAGIWDGTRQDLRRPSETTVGVLGLGRIGRHFAGLVKPVVGRVVGYDPFQSAPEGIDQLELDEVLRTADVVSLHVPLATDTVQLLDRDRLKVLRQGAFIVNVSRGGLIDHESLLELLDSGHIGGAALDVFPQEPPLPGDRLIDHPRILLSPHAAYLSAASARDYVLQQAQNVVQWQLGGRPMSAVVTP